MSIFIKPGWKKSRPGERYAEAKPGKTERKEEEETRKQRRSHIAHFIFQPQKEFVKTSTIQPYFKLLIQILGVRRKGDLAVPWGNRPEVPKTDITPHMCNSS